MAETAEGQASEPASDGNSGDEREGSGAAPASTVSCVTADFAMQNVLLQMGLQLLAPDGRAITRLSRYVLRCSACFFVTKVRRLAESQPRHGPLWTVVA